MCRWSVSHTNKIKNLLKIVQYYICTNEIISSIWNENCTCTAYYHMRVFWLPVWVIRFLCITCPIRKFLCTSDLLDTQDGTRTFYDQCHLLRELSLHSWKRRKKSYLTKNFCKNSIMLYLFDHVKFLQDIKIIIHKNALFQFFQWYMILINLLFMIMILPIFSNWC